MMLYLKNKTVTTTDVDGKSFAHRSVIKKTINTFSYISEYKGNLSFTTPVI